MPKTSSKSASPLPNPPSERPLRKAKAPQPRAASRPGALERRVKLEIAAAEQSEAATEHLLLPVFLIQEDGEWRPVSCESDLLPRVPWEEVDLKPLLALDLPETTPSFLDQDDEPDIAFAGLYLLDILPDPLRGSVIAEQIFAGLSERLGPQRLVDQYVPVLAEMHRHLLQERDRLARQVVHELMEAKTMRFLVVTDEFAPKAPERGEAVQFEFDLFGPTSGPESFSFDRAVVVMPAAQEPLFFWYGAGAPHESSGENVFVLETTAALKADGRLARTKDPRKVFARCTNLAEEKPWSEMAPLMRSRHTQFELIDEDAWKTRLSDLLKSR